MICNATPSHPLREYQTKAIDLLRAEFRAGNRHPLLVLPTGAGKTRVAVEIVRNAISKCGRILWLAHRTELIAQAAARVRAEGVSHVSIITADSEADPSAPIQIASIQTIAARATRPDATLVIFDEAHHYCADQWGGVARHYTPLPWIGLTATPERSDGRPLGDVFDSIVAPISIKQLTDLGHLVPCDTLAPERCLKLNEIAADPVEQYLKLTPGRRAIFFASTVEAAQNIADTLCNSGIPAACVHADSPTEIRADIIARFYSGELLAITNVYILTEGTDIPPAEVCVLARGFGHPSTYIQCVGRVLRPYPGKSRATVIDLTGISRKFGVVSADREYSLDGIAISVAGEKKRKKPEVETEPAHRVIMNLDLKMVQEIQKTARKWGGAQTEYRRHVLEDLLATAAKKGYKNGWAVHRFHARFGVLPWNA